MGVKKQRPTIFLIDCNQWVGRWRGWILSTSGRSALRCAATSRAFRIGDAFVTVTAWILGSRFATLRLPVDDERRAPPLILTRLRAGLSHMPRPP